MALRTWDPWRELSAFERQMDELLGRVGQRALRANGPWAPALDAFHTKDDFVIRLELPGVRPEDVDVEIQENVLVIRGERHFEDEVEDGSFMRRERSYGRFERQILLPEGTDADAIQATFDLGVLEVRVPHPKAVAPKKVKVIGTGGGSTATAVEATSTEAADTESGS